MGTGRDCGRVVIEESGASKLSMRGAKRRGGLCHIKRHHLVNFYISLKNTKNCDISATVWPISTKFNTLMQNVSVKCKAVKFQFKKSKMTEPPSWKSKNRDISLWCTTGLWHIGGDGGPPSCIFELNLLTASDIDCLLVLFRFTVYCNCAFLSGTKICMPKKKSTHKGWELKRVVWNK